MTSTEKSKKKGEESKLAETLKEIRATHGEDSIGTLMETAHVDVDAISTGSMGLDSAIGIGGLPRGRVVEIYGPESSGKTTMALHIIAEAQKMGDLCAFVDAEHALDPQYAQKIGVNINHLMISQPGGGEEALQLVQSIVKTGKVGVVVVDSVAALVPQKELEGNIGDHSMAGQARLMSQALRMLTGSIGNTNTLVIFINQVRADIGAWGPSPETTTGGKALRFYASVRIDIRAIAKIKKGEEIVGRRVRVKVVKNKVSAPFKSAEFDILYGEGISREGELLALGEKYHIITKSGGAIYEYGEVKLGRGYDASRTFLRENTEVKEKLISAIQEAIKNEV